MTWRRGGGRTMITGGWGRGTERAARPSPTRIGALFPGGGRRPPGDQRGDPTDLDAYLFLKAQFHYKLYKYKTQGGHKYRTRIRRQRIVF